MSRRAAPRPLAGAVEALAGRLAPATTLARVQRAWAEAVGADVAAHATPLRERDGVLILHTPEAVWMQELTLMAPVLVGRINAALGTDAIRELRCTATPR